MAKHQTVTVVTPDGAEAQVLPSSVKLYVRKGWTLKEESLERGENEAQLTEADKAQIELAKKVAEGQRRESNQEPAAPRGSDPETEGSDAESKDAVVEIVEGGVSGQPSENGISGGSTDSRRRR